MLFHDVTEGIYENVGGYPTAFDHKKPEADGSVSG